MTNLDATFDIPRTELPASPSASVPRRPGIWRVISMIAVLAALVVSTVSILQARSAGDVLARDRRQVALQTATVSVTNLPVPTGSEIAVLGLADADSRRPLNGDTSIDVPRDSAALVAMTDPSGSIIGLAISPPSASERAISLSVESTGNALIYLSPGILRTTSASTLANVAVIEADPAFQKLLEAIAANPNISESNPAVELAHAEIADRTPVQPQQADQGCDSVFATNAYSAGGTCVQPKDTGLVITNEQDRWALIYRGAPEYRELCATISPTGYEGSEVLIPTEQCPGQALLVAPGPVVNQGAEQPVFDARLRVANAVTSFYEYAGPFAEIAGGSAGFASESIQHIRLNSVDVTNSLTQLLDANLDFADAMEISRTASTAAERHQAAITSAAAILQASDTTNLIPQRVAGDTGHRALLDFFGRSGDMMTAPRTDWRWESDAIGAIEFGTGS